MERYACALNGRSVAFCGVTCRDCPEGWWARPVYGELLIRPATGDAALLHPFLYVIDSKRALGFGEAQG
jgi:hypothetical protein